MEESAHVLVLLMGVAGAGKTTTGHLISRVLEAPIIDADDYHSPSSIRKLAGGIPLTDHDRSEWLRRLKVSTEHELNGARLVILACSALKQSYRDVLRPDRSEMRVVFLDAPDSIITERLKNRAGSIVGPDILPSQRTDLEPPAPGPGVLLVDTSRTQDVTVTEILEWIREPTGSRESPTQDG